MRRLSLKIGRKFRSAIVSGDASLALTEVIKNGFGFKGKAKDVESLVMVLSVRLD